MARTVYTKFEEWRTEAVRRDAGLFTGTNADASSFKFFERLSGILLPLTT